MEQHDDSAGSASGYSNSYCCHVAAFGKKIRLAAIALYGPRSSGKGFTDGAVSAGLH